MTCYIELIRTTTEAIKMYDDIDNYDYEQDRLEDSGSLESDKHCDSMEKACLSAMMED
jgi:hypothetical protein